MKIIKLLGEERESEGLYDKINFILKVGTGWHFLGEQGVLLFCHTMVIFYFSITFHR